MQVDQELIRKLLRETVSDMEPFLDVGFELEVLVGSTILTVRELLGLREGDTIRLDQPADGNVALSIDQQVIAEAEILQTKGTTRARVVDSSR